MGKLTFLVRCAWNSSMDLDISSPEGRLIFFANMATDHRACISEMGMSGPLTDKITISKTFRPSPT